MSGYFFIGFIDFMLKGKSLLEYANLFSPKKYEKNDKTILKKFSIIEKVVMKEFYFFICLIENLKNMIYHIIRNIIYHIIRKYIISFCYLRYV